MKTIMNITYPASALLVFACLALSPQERATRQQGCLTNQNTVQKDGVLINNTGACVALWSAHNDVAVSQFPVAAKWINAQKSAHIEFSASRQMVGDREVGGFRARRERAVQEESLTPPAGLKPVEQEAWLVMARRQGASRGTEFSSFYPARYGEPFVVESEGVRVAVRPMASMDAAAQIDNGQVIYRNAYPETDSMHVVSAGRSEEFLFLQDECAPREFEYELSELSAGAQVELVKGEVHFTNRVGRGVKIEAPWLIEANGALRADAVHWELDGAKSGSGPQRLRLLVANGLRYPVVIDPSWTTTGSMTTVRVGHTATLLPSGQVLVAGGFNNIDGYLSSAELYDPASGMWSATGDMATARDEHTATLLASGQVLVAGGFSNGFHLSSAELYDPATGMWTATGSMRTTRLGHTATLLPSGGLLVAGGEDADGGALSSAELYDPAGGTWTATRSLATARYFHTATLLPSGKVLVAGGINSLRGYLSSAELYDPASGMWTATGSLGTRRDQHTATLLPSGKVLVAGGINSTGYLSSAELYDPASGTWTATGSLATARCGHTATLLPSSKVLVAGGINSTYLSSAELYDPASGTWTATGSLAAARFAYTATLLPSGKVLVARGFNNTDGFLSSAELYDPASGTWTATGSLSTARDGRAATLLPSGKVLVAGGDSVSLVT